MSAFVRSWLNEKALPDMGQQVAVFRQILHHSGVPNLRMFEASQGAEFTQHFEEPEWKALLAAGPNSALQLEEINKVGSWTVLARCVRYVLLASPLPGGGVHSGIAEPFATLPPPWTHSNT